MESVHPIYSYKIEMVQHRAARWTLNRYFSYDRVSEIQSQIGWRSLDQRGADACLCMFYKIMNGLVTVPLPTYFQRTTSRAHHSQSHPPRNTSDPYLVDLKKKSFFPLAVWQWNRLPPNVVLLPTLKQFSVAVRALNN